MWWGSRRFNTIMLMKVLSGLTAYLSARVFNTGQFLNNYWSGLFSPLSTGWWTCSASHRCSTCCTCTLFSHLPVQSQPQRLRKESGVEGASDGILGNRCKLHTKLGQDISATLRLHWIHHTEIVEWIWRYVRRIHLQIKVYILQNKYARCCTLVGS